MVYRREKVMLTLLEKLGAPVSSVKLQKFLFLLCERTEEHFYDFIPYRFGCYSFQAKQDLKHLESLGYISSYKEEDNTTYGLTSYDLGLSKSVDESTCLEASKVVRRYGSLSSDELIHFTYSNYPFYAINSTILERICDSTLIANIEQARPQKNERCLMTIGYEGLSLEAYIVKLILNDVRVLCDVRKNAYSQKFGFTKACFLEKACEGAGIMYIHIPQLGIASEKRQNLNSQSDYDSLFDEYEKTVLSTERDSLNHLFILLQKYGRIALTCFEHDPKQCHRSRIAKKLMGIPQCNYNLINL